MSQTRPPQDDPARRADAAGGGMGDGGDPASASDHEIGPGLQKELKEGGLGQALAGVTGQPGLADADEQSKT